MNCKSCKGFEWEASSVAAEMHLRATEPATVKDLIRLRDSWSDPNRRAVDLLDWLVKTGTLTLERIDTALADLAKAKAAEGGQEIATKASTCAIAGGCGDNNCQRLEHRERG